MTPDSRVGAKSAENIIESIIHCIFGHIVLSKLYSYEKFVTFRGGNGLKTTNLSLRMIEKHA